MRTKKRFAAMLLAALLGLTACGGGEDEAALLFQPAPAYQTESAALPAETGLLLGSCTDGSTVYYLAVNMEDGEEVTTLCRADLSSGEAAVLEEYQPVKPAVPASGPVLSPDGSLWVWETVSEGPGETDGSAAGSEPVQRLRQLDGQTGRALREVEITGAVEEIGSLRIDSWAVDRSGNIALASSDGVTVLDKQGQPRFTLEANLPAGGAGGSAGGTLAVLSDGSIAVLTAPAGGKREVRAIDMNARDWDQKRYELPGDVDLLYGGSGDFLFCYVSDGTLCGWGTGGYGAQRMLSWSSAELEANSVMCFAPLSEGQAAALTYRRTGSDPYAGTVRLLRLIPTDRRSDGRTVLVYGAIRAIPATVYRINEFNRNSDTCYIELRDYGEGLDWSGDYEAAEAAALQRANVEIAAGQVPDILDAQLPLHILAAKGFLEDLWPYIDGDPELGREALMSHVLDCASIDGKLYLVPNGFQVNTAVACAGMVGDRESWTIEEVLALYAAMPEGSTIAGAGLSREWLDRILIDTSRYVDWTTGECSFDSEEFKSLLELCGQFGSGEDTRSFAEDGGTDLRAGRQLFAIATLLGPDDLTRCEAVCGGPEALWDYEGLLRECGITSGDTLRAEQIKQRGGSRFPDGTYIYELASDAVFGALEGSGCAAYVGCPVDSGTGSTFTLSGEMAMSVTCKDKEGAWAFIRQLLLPGGNLRRETDADGSTSVYSVSFPINREDFEAVMRREPVWFVDEEGEYILDAEGRRIEKSTAVMPLGNPAGIVLYFLAPTQEQYDRFMELYNRIERVESYDSTIGNLLIDSTDAYFNGDKSLEDTVDLIQGRVSLYVNENR